MSRDDRQRGRGPARTYANGSIEVHWEPTFCIHSQNCVRRLPAVRASLAGRLS
jgi:uncharacterized Fe-S cluster protein YjdI